MSLSVNVQDNFLPEKEFKVLQERVMERSCHGLPWVLADIVLNPDGGTITPDLHNYQFVHSLYDIKQSSRYAYMSECLSWIDPIVERINPSKLLRAKINLNPITDRIVSHDYHTDYSDPNILAHATTAIFYLNTNNGYTLFDTGNDDKIDSVANRLITFPATARHTGTTCTDTPFRLVLNLNYFE